MGEILEILVEQGLAALDEALGWVEKNDERSAAEFLLAQHDRAGAEACFRKALSIARSQSARSWERW